MYKEIRWIVDNNPEIPDPAHEDLKQLAEESDANKPGRTGDVHAGGNSAGAGRPRHER